MGLLDRLKRLLAGPGQPARPSDAASPAPGEHAGLGAEEPNPVTGQTDRPAEERLTRDDLGR